MKLMVNRGFSLIELLVVIAIIGILAAVGITAYSGYTANAKIQASTTQNAQTVAMVNAEFAKCSGGGGTYTWGAPVVAEGVTTVPTKANCGTATAAHIVHHINVTLGFSNPYNTDGVPAEDADAATADGNIAIDCDASGCTVITDTGGDGANLSQVIAYY